MMMRRWLEQKEGVGDQKRLATTQRGLIFLHKYWEMQELMGTRNKPLLKMADNSIPNDFYEVKEKR
jgi:hypothetical protein